MKKIILILALSIASLFGQVNNNTLPPYTVPTQPKAQTATNSGFTVFGSAGLAVVTPTSGMYSIGVSQSVNTTEDVFADIAITPHGAHGNVRMFLAGFKQNLPSFNIGATRQITVRPFMVVAYGATLENALEVLKAGGIDNLGNPVAAVTALSLNNKFTQNYGFGFTIKGKFMDVSFVGKASMVSGDSVFAYPQVIISKTF